jgi:hypothetical protein
MVGDIQDRCAAELDPIPVSKGVVLHAPLVNFRAVAAPEVLEDPLPVAVLKNGVRSRDLGIVE